jgi:uncharacterized protein YndB with AHSA1/START domain
MEDQMESIVVEQVYEAPSSRVWRAISREVEMRQWFFETIGHFEPKVGFETQFNVQNGEKNFLHLWRVAEVVPGECFTLEWRYGGYPGDSYVTFQLSEESDRKTRMKLTHRGQETFPAEEPAFTRESCERGWKYFVGERLKAYVESH